MKKYLGLFLLLVSFTSFGQFSNYTNINGRYKWIAGKFDSTFTIPSGTTPSLRVGGGTGPGALFYSTTDSTVYQYTGTRWTRLRGMDTAHVVSAYVRNTTASTMTAGQVVYINGSTGTTPTIALAVNTADSTSAMTFGFVRGTIAPNAFGWITTFGPLEGVNTNAYTEGEVIYLDSIPGQFTHDKPQAPYHMVTLGYIVKKSGGNGTIFAKVQNGYELEELHNVRITSPVRNNGILAYDSVAQLWKDTTLSAIGGVTGSGTSGQVAYWTGTSSQSGSNNLFWDNANGRLGIGTNTPSQRIDISGTGIIQNTANTSATFTAINTTSGGIAASFVTANGGSVQFQNGYIESAAVQFRISTTGTQPFVLMTQGTERMRLAPTTGNILINQTTDGGQRLQVNGDALIKGSGNTSGTTALTVQNSDGTNMLRVLNGGFVAFGNSADRPFIFPFTTGAGGVSLTGTNLSFYAYTSTQSATQGIFSFENTASAQTSGNNSFVRLSNTFSPTSGTATQSILFIQNTINQTGGANGITRGLYVNPTLTAAADWRSIEWSNNSGWGLYGAGSANNYIAGDTYIGTTTTSATKLTVAGSETAASAIARGTLINTSLTASANNNVLVGLDIAPTFTNGAFTGVQNIGVRSSGDLVFTSSNAIFYNGYNFGAYTWSDGYGMYNAVRQTNRAFWFGVSNGTRASFLSTDQKIQLNPTTTTEWIINHTANGGGAADITIQNGSNPIAKWFTTGNFAIGSTTDGGQKLQVTGTAIIGSSSLGSSTSILSITSTAGTVTIQANASNTAFFSSGGVKATNIVESTDYFTGVRYLVGSGNTRLASSTVNWLAIQNNSGTNGEGNLSANAATFGAGYATINASAQVEINSTTKGFLPPRMTNAQMVAIATPAAGLVVYDTTNNKLNVYDGTNWVTLH